MDSGLESAGKSQLVSFERFILPLYSAAPCYYVVHGRLYNASFSEFDTD